MTPIFDGHNDILLRLWLAGDSRGQRFISGNPETHIDPPRAQPAGLQAGFLPCSRLHPAKPCWAQQPLIQPMPRLSPMA